MFGEVPHLGLRTNSQGDPAGLQKDEVVTEGAFLGLLPPAKLPLDFNWQSKGQDITRVKRN